MVAGDGGGAGVDEREGDVGVFEARERGWFVGVTGEGVGSAEKACDEIGAGAVGVFCGRREGAQVFDVVEGERVVLKAGVEQHRDGSSFGGA